MEDEMMRSVGYVTTVTTVNKVRYLRYGIKLPCMCLLFSVGRSL